MDSIRDLAIKAEVIPPYPRFGERYCYTGTNRTFKIIEISESLSHSPAFRSVAWEPDTPDTQGRIITRIWMDDFIAMLRTRAITKL